MRLLIKFPTRGRPKLFCETLRRWNANLSGRNQVRFVVSIDEDDTLMNSPIMHGFMGRQKHLAWHAGHSQTKVQAINADLDKLGDYDVLVLASDDMVPVVRGYDDVICQTMRRVWPGLEGVLHFDDGFNRNGLNTLPIMGRKLLEDWGYIYHPAYKSLYCDQEFQDVTERDGVSEKLARCIIRHDWIGTHQPDSLHRRNESMNDPDRATYNARRAAGYPKAWP